MIDQLRKDVNSLNDKLAKLENKLDKILNILEKPTTFNNSSPSTPTQSKPQQSLANTPTPHSSHMQIQSPFSYNNTNFKDRQIQELIQTNNELTQQNNEFKNSQNSINERMQYLENILNNANTPQ